jgi:hypothetical protein
MNNLSKQLATLCLDDLGSQEQAAHLALLMGMDQRELETNLSTAKPLALQQADGKWLSALWVSSSTNESTGELLYIAKHCRTRKLALITANYYRLHALINKSNTDFYTSQQ